MEITCIEMFRAKLREKKCEKSLFVLRFVWRDRFLRTLIQETCFGVVSKRKVIIHRMSPGEFAQDTMMFERVPEIDKIATEKRVIIILAASSGFLLRHRPYKSNIILIRFKTLYNWFASKPPVYTAEGQSSRNSYDHGVFFHFPFFPLSSAFRRNSFGNYRLLLLFY